MKRLIRAKSDNWIDWSEIEENEDFDITGEDFEDEIWHPYLREPEARINEKLKIFPEPSTQAGMGSVFIFDESGEDRWSSYDKEIDFYDWCDKEFDLAREASNADEYAKLYEEWMREVCGL